MNSQVNTLAAAMIALTYNATLFYRGTDKTPAPERAEHFEAAELQRTIMVDGKKVAEKYQGFKRKDVPIAITYEVPEATPAWAILAIEQEIHLYAKALADAYQEVPATLDVQSFTDWITPERGGNDGVDQEALKAALAALQAFVQAITNSESRAIGTAYTFKNKFATKAICSPKGFNVVATQVTKVLTQLGTLLGKFSEAEISTGHEEIIAVWATQIQNELTALEAGNSEDNLFAL